MLNRPIAIAEKKGALMVDAAICMPFFAGALAILVALIVQIGIEESVTRGMVQSALVSTEYGALRSKEAGAAAEKNSSAEKTDAQTGETDKKDKGADFLPYAYESWALSWNSYVNDVWGEDSGMDKVPLISTHIADIPFVLKSPERLDRQIFVRVADETQMPVKMFSQTTMPFVKWIVYRPFVGESADANKKDTAETTGVYVFPKRGECYHKEGCTTMKNACAETVLSSAVRKKAKPCPECGAEGLANGAKVLLPSEQEKGDAQMLYHKPGCKKVEKYYVRMTLSNAKQSGYRACKTCRPDASSGAEQNEDE